MARQMLKDTLKQAVLEMNASDERGIDVQRLCALKGQRATRYA
jgi:DNA polymerase III delta prime subunit